uniref:Uncharacterized protein n=1 Tax=Arundo donax TaxID=35708 RepID=A0A0A8XR97_ARUDO
MKDIMRYKKIYKTNLIL